MSINRLVAKSESNLASKRLSLAVSKRLSLEFFINLFLWFGRPRGFHVGNDTSSGAHFNPNAGQKIVGTKYCPSLEKAHEHINPLFINVLQY
jgi:hypothetical protein